MAWPASIITQPSATANSIASVGAPSLQHAPLLRQAVRRVVKGAHQVQGLGLGLACSGRKSGGLIAPLLGPPAPPEPAANKRISRLISEKAFGREPFAICRGRFKQSSLAGREKLAANGINRHSSGSRSYCRVVVIGPSRSARLR